MTKPAPLPEGWTLVQRGNLTMIQCPHGIEKFDPTRTNPAFHAEAEHLFWANVLSCAECHKAEEKPR